MQKVAIAITSESQELAKQLNLPQVDLSCKEYPYLLVKTQQHLALHFPQNPRQKPLIIDFSHGKMGYRIQHAQGRSELIAKAVGIKKNYRPSVIDTTAGFGRDGLLLAMLGCQVVMLEKNPILYLLVADGLKRLFTENPDIISKIQLTFINVDSLEYLATHPISAEVIYLDPMFPQRTKSAKIKKEMQILQDLLEKDIQGNLVETLFSLALKNAQKRVVVKRPLHADTITVQQPDLTYKGASTRFDVYFR